jgi:hypothetical protein
VCCKATRPTFPFGFDHPQDDQTARACLFLHSPAPFTTFSPMSNNPESADLVTIARFMFPYQAQLFAGKLEAEGIQAYVRDVNHVIVDPFITNALGGIRVQVLRADEEDALNVLQMLEQGVTPDNELPPAINIHGRVYDLVKGICAECSTASVYLARGNDLSAVGAVAVVLTLQFPVKLDHNYFCYNCHYEWKG